MNEDFDLARKMQEIARRKAEVAREEEEAKHAALQELAQVERSIEIQRTELERLENRRRELSIFLGRSRGKDTARIAHGALKELSFEALRRANRSLTSAEVKSYIERSYPDVRISSVPATLSRQVEYGRLRRDETGRYSFADVEVWRKA